MNAVRELLAMSSQCLVSPGVQIALQEKLKF